MSLGDAQSFGQWFKFKARLQTVRAAAAVAAAPAVTAAAELLLLLLLLLLCLQTRKFEYCGKLLLWAFARSEFRL